MGTIVDTFKSGYLVYLIDCQHKMNKLLILLSVLCLHHGDVHSRSTHDIKRNEPEVIGGGPGSLAPELTLDEPELPTLELDPLPEAPIDPLPEAPSPVIGGGPGSLAPELTLDEPELPTLEL